MKRIYRGGELLFIQEHGPDFDEIAIGCTTPLDGPERLIWFVVGGRREVRFAFDEGTARRLRNDLDAALAIVGRTFDAEEARTQART